MGLLDRIQDSFKFLDKNGLRKVLTLVKDMHWTGTHAEYEAQKDSIPANTILHFTDDYEEGYGIVDKIEDNNMQAVTSNAVYNAIGTASPMTVTKQGNYINGTNFHGRKAGKVATVEIDGDTGASIPWEQITTVGVATGCATPLTELKCTADMLSVTTGYDSNGNAITKWIPPYCRAWIGANGKIQVFLANPGASDTSYTGNLFIGGSYITA